MNSILTPRSNVRHPVALRQRDSRTEAGESWLPLHNTVHLATDCRASSQITCSVTSHRRSLRLPHVPLYLHSLELECRNSADEEGHGTVTVTSTALTPPPDSTGGSTTTLAMASAVASAAKRAVNVFATDAFTTSGASGLVGLLQLAFASHRCCGYLLTARDTVPSTVHMGPLFHSTTVLDQPILQRQLERCCPCSILRLVVT